MKSFNKTFIIFMSLVFVTNTVTFSVAQQKMPKDKETLLKELNEESRNFRNRFWFNKNMYSKMGLAAGVTLFNLLSVGSFAMSGLLTDKPELASQFNKVGKIALLPLLFALIPIPVRKASELFYNYSLLSKPLSRVADILEILSEGVAGLSFAPFVATSFIADKLSDVGKK